jgi:Zn-dependent peptidase ImmA (M78 family)
MTPEPIAGLLAEACSAWSIEATDLAARAGVEREVVHAALQGDVEVADLAAIVHALGGTLDDLLSGARFWEAPAVAFKSAGTTFELPLVRGALLRLSGAARDQVALGALLKRSHLDGGDRLAPRPLAADVTAQAEALAQEVRAALGNEIEPIASVRDAMRRLGIPTFLTDFGSKDVDGVTWRDAEGRACVAANVGARGGKFTALRMTFAHELCHALFDGTKLTAFGVVEHRSERGEGLEQRANAFAAHLLAPRRAVHRFLRERGLGEGERPSAVHVRGLSDHFGMGVEAVAWHLVSCALWSRADPHRHSKLTSRDAIGEDNAELHPTDAEEIVPLERRGEILELATLALEGGEITVGRWRELLGVSAFDDWRRLLDELSVSCDVELRTAV